MFYKENGRCTEKMFDKKKLWFDAIIKNPLENSKPLATILELRLTQKGYNRLRKKEKKERSQIVCLMVSN